jgi:hypothetical protein
VADLFGISLSPNKPAAKPAPRSNIAGNKNSRQR